MAPNKHLLNLTWRARAALTWADFDGLVAKANANWPDLVE